ncbi:MAG: hypothetical protein COB66_05065 [Coxiella sp. (in: Bacteria)]|nr:MAG: hypothetical protein COB66_05065 [Coxiella sp. (in: g-proteobacteria)]
MRSNYNQLGGRMKRNTLYIIGIMLSTLLSFQSSFALNPAQIDHVYYFGDSLSDTGYLNHSSNYVPEGQQPVYTTPLGHPAVFYVGQAFNHPTLPNNLNPPSGNEWVIGALGGDDYAAGGAVTDSIGLGKPPFYSPPSLHQQVFNFLSTHQPRLHPNNLYVIWIGANDIFKAIRSTPSSEPLRLNAAINKAITAATTTIQAEVTALYKRGARHIVVINLPPMGDTPSMSKSTSLKLLGNMKSKKFNTQLLVKMLSLKKSIGYSPDIFNVNALFKKIIDTVNTAGEYQEPNTALILKNGTDPACLDSRTNPAIMSIDCNHWVSTDQQALDVFADNVHPSDTTHQILAIHLEQFIKTIK